MYKIGVILTEYTLLLYMLTIPDWEQTFFLVSPDCRIDDDTYYRIKHSTDCKIYGLRLRKILSDINRFPVIHRLITSFYFKSVILYIHSIAMITKKNVHVYGHDHAMISPWLYSFYYTVLEDGLGNYRSKEEMEAHRLPNGKLPLGWDDCIDEIILTNKMPVPKEILYKTKLVNLLNLWNNLTDSKRDLINLIFNYNELKIKKMVMSGRNIFLLTQDFYRFYCTKEYQIEFYRRILKKYNLSNVIIKPHPADDILYERYFPECIVLRYKCPVELIFLSIPQIKKIVSVNSASLYGIASSEILELHEEVYDKIIEFYHKQKQ